MKHVTSIIVALLGLAAVAPAQIHKGSFERQTRSGFRAISSAHRSPAPVHNRAPAVRRGSAHRNTHRSTNRSTNRGTHRSTNRNANGYRGNRHPSSTLRRIVSPILNRGIVNRCGTNGCGISGGHYHTVTDRVWVQGYYRMQHVPAVYGWVYDNCGRRQWGIVQAACTRQVHVPGRYENRSRRVYVNHCR